MAKKMLIDATHPEETRVVVVDGNKVDDFDFETVTKKQLAGNIYLAKVTRVEPSLQAAFVDYGGNRHGFLAFAEIHPDYYQIPVADREALIAEEAAVAAREAESEDEGRRGGRNRRSGGRRSRSAEPSESASESVDAGEDGDGEGGRGGRSRSRRGRGRKRTSQPTAEDNGIAGFGVIDPEGGGLDGAPEPNAGAASAESVEAAPADDVATEAAATAPANDADATAEEIAPETEIAEEPSDAPTDDKDSAAAAAGDDAASGEDAEAEEADDARPPRSIAESAGLEGEDDVVRGDVPAADDATPAEAEEAPAEKPKPRRRRTTKKAKAEAEAPADAEAAPEAKATSAEASTAEPAVSEAAPEGDAAAETGDATAKKPAAKPRRPRRGSKRAKEAEDEAASAETEAVDAAADVSSKSKDDGQARKREGDDDSAPDRDDDGSNGDNGESGDIDTVGAEDLQEEDLAARAIRRRRYKIQDVVKSRQIMLVQVVKEERGTKGAALTTYLSLAGRYCVLMPNTARGGGISRKITNASDRKRLREIVGELEVPQGMGLIVRTAGAERTRAEIKRDYEFLLRQWEQIRELTLRSSAPCLIYEEGSLIKRSIRDIYSKEIDAIHVEGEGGYREAKDYMKMLMPSHAKNVQQYIDTTPLFIRYQVESYLNGMFSPVVQLKSGGYLVIGVTEALVAIDVNSGRSTKEGSIEETATKTNLEAADEVARQLRLRDLAGLIVIDFIDMDESRNNRAVEKRMKDRLKNDRARIQVGRISGFGLMEMSRQRLRPGMLEATTKPCPHCHGQGLIRSDESLALGILREIEEEGVKGRASELMATMPVDIANFIVNSKRRHLAQIEERYGIDVQLLGDPSMVSPEFRVERVKGAERKPERTETSAISAERSASLIDDAEVVEEAPAREREGDRERDRDRERSRDRDEDREAGRRRSEEGRDDQGEGGGKKRRRGKRGGRRRRGNGDDREEGRQNSNGGQDDEGREGGIREHTEQQAAAEREAAEAIPSLTAADLPVEMAEEAAVSSSANVPEATLEEAVGSAEETVAEVVTESPAEPETGAPALAEEMAPAAEEAAVPAEAEADLPIDVATAAMEPPEEEAEAPVPEVEDPSKPKRRGWWSLRR
ncbi:MAG: Rne/Rng family ribonuclease [Pseudomonadota bacterium]